MLKHGLCQLASSLRLFRLGIVPPGRIVATRERLRMAKEACCFQAPGREVDLPDCLFLFATVSSVYADPGLRQLRRASKGAAASSSVALTCFVNGG